jgi:hypothetical protein
MSKRKFYKTTFKVVVLTEEPYDPFNLEDIEYDIKFGHASGAWEKTASYILSGKEMVMALNEQGSDLEFFMLNEDGTDINE